MEGAAPEIQFYVHVETAGGIFSAKTVTPLLSMQAVEVDNSFLADLINLAPVFEEEIPEIVSFEVSGSQGFEYSIPSIIDLENENFEIKVFGLQPFMSYSDRVIHFEPEGVSGTYSVTIQLTDESNNSRNQTISFEFE